MEKYLGYTILNDDEITAFYSGTYDLTTLRENQYLVIGKEVYKYQNGEATRVNYLTIDSHMGGIIKPRNIEQRMAVDLLKDRTSKVKVLRGVFGSGKIFAHG